MYMQHVSVLDVQQGEHLRQHAGDHGEVRDEPGGDRRRAHAAAVRGEEEDRGAAPHHAAQVTHLILHCPTTMLPR